jgi:hypothetical protein
VDAQRRQKSCWWFERQRQSFLQRSESGEAGAEAASAASKNGKRCWTSEIILRKDERHAGADEETEW